MRPPSDMPQTARPSSNRRRRWIIAAVIIVIIVIASLRTFAIFYTDALWFSSVSLHSVWVKLFEIKFGLMVVFAAIFAVMLLASLLVAERLAPKGPSLDAEDEFVKRYQEVIGPYARWLRAGVVVVLSLIIGSQAIGQWNNWILFRNSTPFPATDPQFHRNVGYFVFTLPFEQFLVHWTLVALVVVLLVTLLSHYLNGGIRLQGSRPRVRPAVKAHISVILGLLALVKAVGYYLARFNLDLSSNGYVQGAGYTDVHARLPALELLILVSLAAAVLLIYNIRRQGWALPILGVGLWFLVALTAGTIYPAAVQALKVNPAQNTLERPYIQRNIDATRTAMGINNVQSIPYPASSNLTAAQLSANSDTLANVRLWDPTQTQPTYDKKQDIRSYYQFNALAVDRYKVDGQETPTVVGVREINDADLPSTSWVNTTLQYTHGYGMIVSPANAATSPTAIPSVRGEGRAPGVHQRPARRDPAVGLLRAQQLRLRGGQHQAARDRLPADQRDQRRDPLQGRRRGAAVQLLRPGHVRHPVQRHQSDHLQPDHQRLPPDVRPWRAGPGDQGRPVPQPRRRPLPGPAQRPHRLGAGRLHHHRQLSLRPERRHQRTAPGQRPQPEPQLRAQLGEGPDRRLHRQDDLLRDGLRTIPIIQTYEKAFPGMFTPASKMSAALRAHLRYPEDIFTLQATTYGKYHITTAQSFYSAADAWTLSPSPGSGSPSQALATTLTTNAQGQQVSTGQLVRMAPIYQELRVPGQAQQSFNLLDAFVPVSGQSQIQTLSGFMIAGSDPGHYGQLQMFVTPPGQAGRRPGHRGGADRRHPDRSPRRSPCSTPTGRRRCWATC